MISPNRGFVKSVCGIKCLNNPAPTEAGAGREETDKVSEQCQSHHYLPPGTMSRKFPLFVILGFFLTVCVVIVWKYGREQTQLSLVKRSLSDQALSLFNDDLKRLTAAQIDMQMEEIQTQKLTLQKQSAEISAQIALIPFKIRVKQYSYLAAPVVMSLCVVVVSVGLSVGIVRRKFVFTAKLDAQTEIPVRYADLPNLAPVILGNVEIRLQKAIAGNQEEVRQHVHDMLADFALLFKAIGGKRGLAALPEAAPAHIDPPITMAARVPTFQELLQQGEIARGKPMILGYINGAPRRGSFQDIYSAAVAGESGSGKTVTLLYLIGCGLVAEGIRFLGIDPHYPHPKSLGFKTKALWEQGKMEMAVDLDQARDILRKIGEIITNRLTQQDTATTPVVLVIDELAWLMKTSIAGQLGATMTRVSTEGRKCAVYMLASSQTWLVESTGGSSVVRDTLTSAFIHKIKPKQANLILQDREEVEKVKKHVKHAGECLLCSVQNDSALAQIPFTTERDLLLINNLVNGQPVDQVVDCPVDSTGLVKAEPVDLVDQVNALLKNDGDFSELVKATGLDKAYVSRILHHKQAMSRNAEARLQAWLQNKE